MQKSNSNLSVYIFSWIICGVILQAQIEIPNTNTNGQVISHLAYTLEYSETHEQAYWVAYELTASEVSGAHKRSNNFRPDQKIRTGSAALSDYRGSGYDRGHLAPAGDMKWSSTAMSESFFMSNMSPQDPGFNRGIWKKLESNVRSWAEQNGSIFVVTGGILEPILPSIGGNRVAIPRYFYKVVLDYQQPGVKAIGFILPNQKSSQPFASYAVSIDAVEARTGIDFFPKLPDEIEPRVESEFNMRDWPASSSSSRDYSSGGTTTQCLGNTTKGLRCRNKTNNDSGYCYLHDSKNRGQTKRINSVKQNKTSYAVQCSGTTQRGARCKRKTKSANGRCYLHGG